MKNIKIYVVSHSEEDIQKIKADEIYTPLFVGRNGKDNLGFLSDDSFKGNISSKNKDYCELTGLYWMWNDSDADIIGLCHYRRYLKSDSGKLLQKNDIIDYLNDYDIILPKKAKLIKKTYWETYKNHYLSDALTITRQVIKDIFPEYLSTFDEILSQDAFSNYNMFIMPKKRLNDYCSWIFPILNEVENRINVDDYPRVLGLISEAILNVWVKYNELKVKECEVYYLGNSLKFRMFLINNPISRNLYQTLYFKFLKTTKVGQHIENFIYNLFY